jgi:hypothetical protein
MRGVPFQKMTIFKICPILYLLITRWGNRDSVVGIATGYGLYDREVGVRVSVEVSIFTSPRRPDRLWESTQPPMQRVPGVKRSEREADHSPTTNTEVKKTWIYTSTPPYAVMA